MKSKQNLPSFFYCGRRGREEQAGRKGYLHAIKKNGNPLGRFSVPEDRMIFRLYFYVVHTASSCSRTLLYLNEKDCLRLARKRLEKFPRFYFVVEQPRPVFFSSLPIFFLSRTHALDLKTIPVPLISQDKKKRLRTRLSSWTGAAAAMWRRFPAWVMVVATAKTFPQERAALMLNVMSHTRSSATSAERAFMAEVKDMENYADRVQVCWFPGPSCLRRFSLPRVECFDWLTHYCMGLVVGCVGSPPKLHASFLWSTVM